MVSVVMCSNNPEKFEPAKAMYRRLLAGGPFEIIAIRDVTGLAEGYNRGVATAQGSILIFVHDDVEFLANDFRSKLLGHLEHCDVLGVQGTTRLRDGQLTGAGPPYSYGQVAVPNPTYPECYDVQFWSVQGRRSDGMQALDGLFICAKRHVAESIRFDQETFCGFHLYDLDFTFRAHLAGYSISVANDLYPVHRSHGDKGQHWKDDKERFEKKFSGRLFDRPWRPFKTAAMAVTSKAEVIDVMTPLHWQTSPRPA
jgi:GT2 family glycosyltransferase